MRIEMSRAQGAATVLVLGLLAGCASPPAPPPAPVTIYVPTPVPAQPAGPTPVDRVLAYADRVRPLAPSELALEVQRLGDGSASPVQAVQLAVALAQTNDPAQLPRAQVLVQRVLAQRDAEAQALHPLARLVGARIASQLRDADQAERTARELREARRRLDVLHERLEAVRAIERSLPSPPPAPAPATRPTR
jgi:hypothetical protein